jgi:hypothetical protein
VFECLHPSAGVALQLTRDKAPVWSIVRAKGLSSLQSMAGVG